MPKFKVGDKVKLKSGLTDWIKYNQFNSQSCMFIPQMRKFFEEKKIGVIESLCQSTGYISIKGIEYSYSEDMLELADEFEKGEVVEVSANNGDTWHKRMFVTDLGKLVRNRYITASAWEEPMFLSDREYAINSFTNCRKILVTETDICDQKEVIIDGKTYKLQLVQK